MDNIDQAIYGTVHGSTKTAKQISSLMAMSHQVLINKANPQNETHKITLREAVTIQLITGNQSIYRAMGTELALNEEGFQPVGIMESALKAGKEHGDVISSIYEALEDGKMTMREQEKCQREITEAIDALMQLRESVLAYSMKQIKG